MASSGAWTAAAAAAHGGLASIIPSRKRSPRRAPRLERRLSRLHTIQLSSVSALALAAAWPTSAQAVCSTSGSNPVVFSCSGTVTTTNTINSASPNPSTADRNQIFNDSISGTINSGAVINGTGLSLNSSLNGSTVSLTNNGTASGTLAPSVQLGGSGANTLSYGGTGSITATGAVAALGLFGAGTGSATATISGSSAIKAQSGVGVFNGDGIQINASTGGSASVIVQTGGLVQGNNGVVLSGAGTNSVNNNGSIGTDLTVTPGIIALNGISGDTIVDNSLSVTNQVIGRISGSNAGITVRAGGSVAVTNNLGGSITGTGTTSAGISAGSVTGSNAGTISGVTSGIDTTGVGNNAAGSSVNLTSNSGSIFGTGASGIGIHASTGVNVTNNAGMIQGNQDGITGAVAGSTLATSAITIGTNSGTIAGTSNNGITALSNTVTVTTNAQGATISGGASGIVARSIMIGSNAGTISGGTGAGLVATAGTLSVTNAATGTISGATGVNSGGTSATVTNNGGLITGTNDGVLVQGGTASVSNTSGTISGTGGAIGVGISSNAAGVTINLSNGGTVSGTQSGVAAQASGTINVTSNTGTITGVSSGIATGGSATITNNMGGQITGTGASGLGISAGTTLSLTNSGAVTGTGGGAIQTGMATITNNSTGTISSTGNALGTIVTNGATSLSNAGSITSTNGVAGIFAISGNLTITSNTGSITATGSGIGVAAQSLTITNGMGGTISGALDGINQQGSGPTTVTNTGTISAGTRSAVRLGSNASVINTGTGLITSVTGIVFRDPTGTNTAVVNGSVFNSGTITGTGGTAINFNVTPGSGPFTLTLGPGSVINGTVLGTGGDVFQLGGTGIGTLNASNIGAAQQYQGFTTFNKISTSTWTLTGTGAANQNWNISGGTLVGDTNSIKSTTVTISNNALLDLSQTFNGTFAGAITGTGGLTKDGSGTLILTGANNYNGTTTISGGTLQVGNGGTSGTLGTSSVVLMNGTLAINHSDTVTIANAISGSGGLSQIGTGTTVLTGANSYQGNTTVTAGTLALSGAGTLGNVGSAVTVNGATAILDLGGTTQTQNGGVSLLNGGTIANGTLSSSSTFDLESGSVSASLAGSRGVNKTTAGTVTLSGANSYQGTTDVTGGTLVLSGAGTLGNVGNFVIIDGATTTLDLGGTTQTQNGGVLLQNGGTVANGTLSSSGLFDMSAGAASANLTGSGSLLKVGLGTVILTGANSYTGTTTISSGTLQIGNGGTSGTLGTANVVDNATLAFNRSDTITVANNISGTGIVNQIGGGTLILTGANNYSGTTTISAGTLQIGNGGSSGTLGTGNVVDNATLTFNRSDAVAVANAISGSGVVNFNGSGTTTLTGSSTYAGATNVNAGVLAVTGSITSSVNVNNGVLTGTGAVGGAKVANGATLAPGQNGLGTLTVNGSLMLQSASLYLVSVNATTSGRTNVTGTATVGGTVVAAFQGSSFQRQYTILSAASINGQFSSLITVPAMFNASLQQTATEVDLIVSSGLTKVSGLSGNQQAVANALDNSFNSGQGTLAGLTGLSPSQFAAALSILSGEGLSGTQESALGAGGLVLDTLQQQALDGLGGDGGGSSTSASATGAALGYAAEKKRKGVPAVFKAPLKAPVFEPRWRAWSAGFGGSWRLNGQGDVGSADIRHSTGGGMAGLDHLVAPNVLVGAAVGGSASSFSVPDRATSGTLDGVNVGLYGGARQGAWYATAAVTFAAFDNKTSRTIAGVGPTELANARFNSDLWGGRIETGYRFAWGTATVTPFAAVQPTELRVAGFTESSTTLAGTPGVLGLTAPSHTVDSLPTFVGVQFDQHLTLANMAWSPYGRISWVHEFRPTRDITASFVTLPAAGFTVFGPRAARDAVRIDAGSKLQVSRNVYLFDSFDGEFAQGSQLYSGKGGVTIAW